MESEMKIVDLEWDSSDPVQRGRQMIRALMRDLVRNIESHGGDSVHDLTRVKVSRREIADPLAETGIGLLLAGVASDMRAWEVAILHGEMMGRMVLSSLNGLMMASMLVGDVDDDEDGYRVRDGVYSAVLSFAMEGSAEVARQLPEAWDGFWLGVEQANDSWMNN